MAMNSFGALTAKVSIGPQSTTDAATTTGSAVDLQGTEGDVLFIASLGSLSGSDATFTWSVVDCDTSGGSYAAVTGGSFATVPTFASDNTAITLSLPRTSLRQFVKMKCVNTGTTTALIGGTVVYRSKTV